MLKRPYGEPWGDRPVLERQKGMNTGSQRRYGRRFMMLFGVLFLLPLGVSVADHLLERRVAHWWQADTHGTGQAPDPATTPEAVVQVYAARAFGWRGVLGVHTWVAVKPANASGYTRLEVMGWGVDRGRDALRKRHGSADALWFGSRPTRLVDLRGEGVDEIIEAIFEAAEQYPYRHRYRLWPGPNSNTFVAYLGRRVPQLRLDLPPTAIGKDYLPGGGFMAVSPSGTGVQLSLYGVAGVLVGLEEGVEVNLLGLSVGVDVWPVALKLPGIGRIGLP